MENKTLYYLVDIDNIGYNSLLNIPDNANVMIFGSLNVAYKIKPDIIQKIINWSRNTYFQQVFVPDKIRMKNATDFIMYFYAGSISNQYKDDKENIELVICSNDKDFLLLHNILQNLGYKVYIYSASYL